MQVYVENLGCARNQVDGEIMQTRLQEAGCKLTNDSAQAEIIIVNTCSFIDAAADESIDTILALADYKKKGVCHRLIVTGCLPQRYGAQIARTLPEVNLFLGTGAYDRIVEAVQQNTPQGACWLPDPNTAALNTTVLQQPTQPHAVYLKIAEGCNRRCTFCIIPKLRGVQRSRAPQTILAEASTLIAAGAKELTLVAQETTAYNHDLTEQTDLAQLLLQLAALDDSVWIRFLYGHPQTMTSAIIQAMRQTPNLCPYVDIPIQHASNRILRRMGRRYTQDDLIQLFTEIRQILPQVAIRTTLLVGFPGEDDADFEQLVDFINKVRFEHLGIFTYSNAKDLAAHYLKGHVSPQKAQARLGTLMQQQRKISNQLLNRYLHQRLDVLVEKQVENGLWVGRTRFQAPEVDGETLIRVPQGGKAPIPGQIETVRIVETMEYDLIAETT